MTTDTKTQQALRAENTNLRARLEEAEETLRAISSGEVDALVVGGQIYTLESADAASNRFRGEVLAQVNDAVITVDNDDHITYLNTAAERLYGVAASEVLGRKLDAVRHSRWLRPEDEDAALATINETGFWRGETIQTKHSGEEIQVESSVSILRDLNGVTTGLLAVSHDVSERKQAEEQLRRNHETFFNLVLNAPFGVYVVDADFRLIQISAGSRKVFSNVDPLIGRDFAEVLRVIWAEPFATEMIERFRHTLATGEPYRAADTSKQRGDIEEVESYDWKIERITLPDGRFGVVCYFYDLTERERLRETAEAHNRAKDEFLTVISHELRSPLSAILGYTRITRMSAHDAAVVVRNCEIIERNAKVQQQLIEDLLDTARIISGKLKIEAESTDLRLLLEEALTVVRPAAEAKRIDLVARLGDEPQQIIGDAMRLGQIAWNLLQNAIKFTPDGGRVELRLEREGSRIHIIVSDTGKGIEPEFLSSVFDRFSQQDATRTRRFGGLGLGLALVKQLVELHGGTAAVASAGVGIGATFTVTLPLRATNIAAYLPPVPAIAEIRTGPDIIPLDSLPRLDGVRVLLVDDQEDTRRLVAATLGDWGAVVTMTATGAEARAMMASAAFDVLVCDIAMPDEDGYQVIGRIRALERERGVPLPQRLPAIALTALARAEDRLQAMSAGFQMHVAKPVEMAELVVVIATVIGNRQPGSVLGDSTQRR